MTKNEIRKNAIELRRVLNYETREYLSHKATLNFFKLINLSDTKMLFSFISTQYEIQTKEIIATSFKHEIKVCYPKVLNDHDMKACLLPPDFDTKVKTLTIDKDLIDVCLMPGLAFTKIGQRLGYGKGYYDRYLENSKCLKIGLCFDFQVVDYIPVTDFDINADFIVTDKRIINCKKTVLEGKY